MDRQGHWNGVYTTKAERDVSWFEALPSTSLRMLESAGISPDTCVIDIGAAIRDSSIVWPRAGWIAWLSSTSRAPRFTARRRESGLPLML